MAWFTDMFAAEHAAKAITHTQRSVKHRCDAVLREILLVEFFSAKICACIISRDHACTRQRFEIPGKRFRRHLRAAEMLINAVNVKIQAAKGRIVAIEKPNAGSLNAQKITDLFSESPQLVVKTLRRILLRQGQPKQNDLAFLKLALTTAELLELNMHIINRIDELGHNECSRVLACRNAPDFPSLSAPS
jgi:hypothetical protein